MHRVFFIREILFHIFSHCSNLDGRCRADLAALARTCRTFKEPALDVLWEDLSDLFPLARCLPEVCKFYKLHYSFTRPLSEAEWTKLRGYTRRVRYIRQAPRPFDEKIVSALAPFTDPLFPNLRSLFWEYYVTLPVVHTAVLSLTSLQLSFQGHTDRPLSMDFLDALGERCPNIRQFSVFFPRTEALFAAISRQLCRWTHLQHVYCRQVVLSMATILSFPSMSSLTSFAFTLSAELHDHITHASSAFVFLNLTDLEIISTRLKPITDLFSRIQLPKIKDLTVTVSGYIPRWDFGEYWATIQKACPSNTLSCLSFSGSGHDNATGADKPSLTLNDLLPYKEFGNLRLMKIDIPWSVNLTDSDILHLVSTLPQLESLSINFFWGWRMNGDGSGITLSGLVKLLRRCPFLDRVVLAIDTRTFTAIPHGLDVSVSPRGPRGSISLDYLDSNIAPGLVRDLEGVFAALRLHAGVRAYSSFHSSSGDIIDFDDEEEE